MLKRLSTPGFAALAFLALTAFPIASSAASPVKLLSADARGMTLQLEVPDPRLSPPDADGAHTLTVPGFRGSDVPGRPALPFVSVLVALPLGASADARVESEAPWESFGESKLAIAGHPEFRGEGQADQIAVRTPAPTIADGPWPRSTVEVGEPFSMRRQRMVAVVLRPIRWDAATGRITRTRSITVRVDFRGGAPAGSDLAPIEEDRHWEPVLREALLNYEQARGWRAKPARLARRSATSLLSPGPARPAANAAFDEGNTEVRVQLDTTGVYELSFAELSAKGYPNGVPIAQVSVHRHEFVEGANPPYVTIELPIEVDDDGNGVFDENDRIVLFVQSWAERARASRAQRNWGDGEVIYVTSVAGNGLRMPTRPGWRNVPGLTPIPSYPWTQRWEKNLVYYLFPPDTLTDQFHWTEIQLYYERPDTLVFETHQIDTTHSVTVSASFVGRRNGPHVSWAQYRRPGGPFLSVADSLVWFGVGAQTATATYPGSTLGEGLNTMRTWGKGSTAAPDPINNNSDNTGFNYIQATYWRRYQPIFQYLSCNTANATGEVQIAVPGFVLPAARVYDVTDSLVPVRLTIDPAQFSPVGNEWQVDFQDSVTTGQPRQYIVWLQPRPVDPSRYTAVTRRQLTNRTSADYLVIVPEEFRTGVAPLIALRQANGLNVVEAPFEAVCDEFNGGRRSSHAIKRFLRYAYDNWNAKFVLLVGDGSEDPQNFMAESSRDRIPVHKINGPVAIQFGYEVIPSDPWYVCMENCDLNSFTTPVLQDMFIGRLPVQSLQQTNEVVQKLVKYEDLSGDQSWRSRILLSDDDAYSAETFFGGGGTQLGYCFRAGEPVFRALNETIADLIHNGAGLQQAVLDTFHLDTFLRNVGCANPDCSCKDLATTQQFTHGSVTLNLIDRINQGRMWWNFQGHANEFVLAHEDLYVNRGFQDDKGLLLNDNMPYLFSAFSCHANAFARFADRAPGRGPALGEEMVTLPARGAIASWASTGYEILPFSGASHINVAWAEAMFQDPPFDTYAGQSGARVVLGETIALALARYVPGVLFNSSEKGIGLSYHLLGDPGTRLSIGPPEAVVLANQVPVVDGQPVRLHTPADTLRLEADLVSNVALTSIALDRTDASGTVTIDPADYTLTSGASQRRFHLSYSTTLSPTSYHYTFRTVDRYGVPGTFVVRFQFLTQLLLDNSVLAEGDPVPPSGNLSLRVFSPMPLDPAADLTLTVNGASQPFTFAALPADTSGREWVLTWNHAPYPIDDYEVRLAVVGGGTYSHHFRVLVGGTELQVQNPLAFPNPFDDDRGTAFSFLLVSGNPVDVQIRVFTTNGRLLYERIERGLSPGYHQLPWDGLDADGDKLANGVYIYRLLATNGASNAEHLGRLVKLRRPRRADSP